MPNRERNRSGEGQEPSRAPYELPPELAAFLRDKDYACLAQATDMGTAYVIKVPEHEIASVRGTVPVHIHHALYAHPAAPVIRTVLTIYDQPQSPLALESYCNIDDPQQLADFAALANQDTLYLLFYDESLAHRLTKLIPHAGTELVAEILREAQRVRALIPNDQFDFDRAKAAVLEATRL